MFLPHSSLWFVIENWIIWIYPIIRVSLCVTISFMYHNILNLWHIFQINMSVVNGHNNHKEMIGKNKICLTGFTITHMKQYRKHYLLFHTICLYNMRKKHSMFTQYMLSVLKDALRLLVHSVSLSLRQCRYIHLVFFSVQFCCNWSKII